MVTAVAEKRNKCMVVSTQEAYKESIRECSAALELKPEYLKALMRRSEAHNHLEHQEDALAGARSLGIRYESDTSLELLFRHVSMLMPILSWRWK